MGLANRFQTKEDVFDIGYDLRISEVENLVLYWKKTGYITMCNC